MDPYPHGTGHLKGKDRWIAYWHITCFMTLLTGVWLSHVLIFGWYQYLFCARGYVIKSGSILEDLEIKPNYRWWNKHDCAAAKKAASLNHPEDYVIFTWRVHPFFLDSEFLYVSSKGYNARIFDEREKIYAKRK